MRFNFLLLFFCLSIFGEASSQSSNTYYYQQFINGRVDFKNGKSSNAKLNYNLALQEMQFINTNGDTLALSGEDSFSKILIGKDSFYYNDGYLRVEGIYNDVKLLSKVKKVATQKQRGAYGEDISGSAANNVNNVVTNSYGSVKINQNEGSYGNFEIAYFMLDATNKYIPVSRKSILKHFEANKKALEDYMATNQIDYNNGAQVMNLLTYATSLK